MLPALLEPASIYVKWHTVVLTGSAPLLYQSLPAYTSFLSYLQGFPEEQWCYSNIFLSVDEYFFIQALQSNGAVAVSDGSHRSGHGTAAWILTDKNRMCSISGSVIAPGAEGDQDSYRSELTDLYCIILIMTWLKKYDDMTEGTIMVGYDG